DTWAPDVVIASDDNAAKQLIVAHYKDSSTPFLFCGVNWDASVYGFPTKNVTGMVEVAPVIDLISFLKQYSDGVRIGYLGADVVSERKEVNHYKKVLGLTFEKGYLVDSFSEWKEAYLDLQNSVDFIILLNPIALKGWNKSEAETFVETHSEIPSGSTTKMLRTFVMMSFSRIAEEQGIWAGERALEVISGKKIEDIPVTHNKRSSKYLNLKLAKKLNIVFPATYMDSVILVEEGF
ncbi:MAG: ABC transporter substrate-binding protein, partial [Proteobacteria bacterium]|nr:ABC transporter substrate-binding protein [Pseudomonadota bacterium]